MGSSHLNASELPSPLHRKVVFAFCLVLLIAFLFRFGIGWIWKDRLRADPDAYAVIAVTLAETGVFGLSDGAGHTSPTAFRPPLYPWFLSFLVSDNGELNLVSVAIAHAFLGALTVVLSWDFARRLLRDLSGNADLPPSSVSRLPWFAAGFVAIDPLLVWQSTVVMTETLATLLAVAAAWLWCVLTTSSPIECSTDLREPIRRMAGVASFALSMSLAYLCRPTFLVWGLMMLPLMWWSGPTCRIRRSAMVLVYGLIVSMTVSLWTMRNAATMGAPIWATTHGGYTLLLANNESFYEHVRNGWLPFFREPWDPQPFFDRYAQRLMGDVETAEFWLSDSMLTKVPSPRPYRGEVDDDLLTQRAAVATIRRDIPTFFKSCVYRMASLWNPFPNKVEGRSGLQIAITSLIHVCLYVGCVVALFRHRQACFAKHFWPMWALAVSLSLVHAVYFSNPRMRAPIEPMLAVLSMSSFVPCRRYDG